MDKDIKVALIGGFVTLLVAIISLIHPSDPNHLKSEENNSEPFVLSWGFDKGLEDWDRTGTAPSWKNNGLEGAVQWHGEWANSIGIVVMDACNEDSAGIEKRIFIPNNMKSLVANAAKYEQDGGIRFKIIDSSGPHLLGEAILRGREKRTFSYDISKWSGMNVVVQVKAFGYGDNNTTNCQEGSEACCGEYVGLDRIELVQ